MIRSYVFIADRFTRDRLIPFMSTYRSALAKRDITVCLDDATTHKLRRRSKLHKSLPTNFRDSFWSPSHRYICLNFGHLKTTKVCTAIINMSKSNRKKLIAHLTRLLKPHQTLSNLLHSLFKEPTNEH